MCIAFFRFLSRGLKSLLTSNNVSAIIVWMYNTHICQKTENIIRTDDHNRRAIKFYQLSTLKNAWIQIHFCCASYILCCIFLINIKNSHCRTRTSNFQWLLQFRIYRSQIIFRAWKKVWSSCGFLVIFGITGNKIANITAKQSLLLPYREIENVEVPISDSALYTK